ncbi:MAG: hypothetical protein AAF385_10260, partial [Pseudomonadota bacterium]
FAPMLANHFPSLDNNVLLGVFCRNWCAVRGSLLRTFDPLSDSLVTTICPQLVSNNGFNTRKHDDIGECPLQISELAG